MHTVELYRKVRLACRDGMSERAAARHFGISRESVMKMLCFSVPPGYRRTAPVRRRLIDMGVGVAEVIKPGNVALLMKQTLLPLLCPDCALERHAEGRVAPENLAARLRGNGAVRYRNPRGCPRCRREGGGAVAARAWNGYIEQTAIAETIRPDAGYLAFVRDRDPLGAWAYWRQEMGGAPIG